MKMNKLLLSAAMLSALCLVKAEERVLNMDFSAAPEKIEEVRAPGKKVENVNFYLAIPPTGGKDFTFQCLLLPQGMRAYSGFSVGIGIRKMAARRFSAQLRLGDGNRSSLMFLSRGKILAKPGYNFKVEPMTITIQYHAANSTMDFQAAGKSGNVIAKAEKVPVPFNNFSADCIVVSVIDKPGAGEAYLSYNAEKQRLEGKSFLSAAYFSNFAVDDIKITYAQ